MTIALQNERRGDIPFHRGSQWDRLPIGTAGQFLWVASGLPAWTGVSSIDHGGLGGLTDDDHTQYALLAGRSGGQTLKGDTASAGNLTLQSTAHATRGKILFGSAGAYDEANNRLGVGTASPSANNLIQATGSTNTSRLYLISTHANGLAGIRLEGTVSSVTKTWFIDNRGGVDSPNSRIAAFNPAATAEVFSILDGAPGAGVTVLRIAEGTGPTLRAVQFMDPGAGGANFAGGERVMILV